MTPASYTMRGPFRGSLNEACVGSLGLLLPGQAGGGFADGLERVVQALLQDLQLPPAPTLSRYQSHMPFCALVSWTFRVFSLA